MGEEMKDESLPKICTTGVTAYVRGPTLVLITNFASKIQVENKELFVAFADEDLWRKINTTSSQMLSMCRNPLMLQMIISNNIHPSEDIGDASTTTRLFATVMESDIQSQFSIPRNHG
ncbi:unnamed protein product [Clavelina lepadiformis]|uniref:Uncharacterized protein n=1 Tax=Clavelina lepadiformis TaxID=159417 RepID=A0ABP0FQA9_CLALP